MIRRAGLVGDVHGQLAPCGLPWTFCAPGPTSVAPAPHSAGRGQVYPSIPLLLCGHTHRRMAETFDDVTVVNAGSLDGLKGDPPTVTLIDFEGKATALAETHSLRR